MRVKRWWRLLIPDRNKTNDKSSLINLLARRRADDNDLHESIHLSQKPVILTHWAERLCTVAEISMVVVVAAARIRSTTQYDKLSHSLYWSNKWSDSRRRFYVYGVESSVNKRKRRTMFVRYVRLGINLITIVRLQFYVQSNDRNTFIFM